MDVRQRIVAVSSIVIGVTGCSQPLTTTPYPVSATAAVEQHELDLPPDLEVKSASYSITALADVTGTRGSTTSNAQVRPLLTIYAVRRTTGEQLVLIYEDLSQRKQPSQIIRLMRAPEPSK